MPPKILAETQKEGAFARQDPSLRPPRREGAFTLANGLLRLALCQEMQALRWRERALPSGGNKGGVLTRRRSGVFLLCLLSLLFPSAASSKALILIGDHISYNDLKSDLPATGIPGLMSEGMPSGPDPVATVYASLGAGDSIGIGNVSQGRLERSLRSAGLRTAVIGDADGDDTGSYRPVLTMLPSPDIQLTGVSAGEINDPISPGGRRADPVLMTKAASTALKSADLVVVHDGDMLRLEREQASGFLTKAAYAKHRLDAIARFRALMANLTRMQEQREVVFFVLSSTPPWSKTGRWDSLTPCAVRSLGFYEVGHGLLTSSTTRTPGLIAARDIAPAILTALYVRIPIQMTGAPLRALTGEANVLDRLDRLTTLNQQVQTPFFWVVGFVGAGVAFASLLLIARRRSQPEAGFPRWIAYGLRASVSWPLALMIAPILGPTTVAGYLVLIVVVMLVLALLPTPELILASTAGMIVLDGLFGSKMIAQSVLSTYALAGIRFYGIGNEYMGMLIGGSLAMIVLLDRNSTGIQKHAMRGIAWWFITAVFVLSFPAFGAKAGGAITAMSAFLFAWWLIKGIKIGWQRWLFAVGTGFALVFLWAFVDHFMGSQSPTHIDSAVGAVTHGRLGYILGVVFRKAGLALRVLFHPGTLLGIAAFVLLILFAKRTLHTAAAAFMDSGPARRAFYGAGIRGALVALLFNDSGAVAAILITMSMVVSFIHGIVREDICGSYPLTSAKSE